MLGQLIHQIKKSCTPIQETVKGDNYTLETWIKFITESYYHDPTRKELCNLIHFLYTNNLITPDDLHNINHGVFDAGHFVSYKIEYDHKYWLKAQVSIYSTIMAAAADTTILARTYAHRIKRLLLGESVVPILAPYMISDEDEVKKRNIGKQREEQEQATEIYVSSKIDHFLGSMQTFLYGLNMYKAYTPKNLNDTLTLKIMLILDDRIKSLIAQTAMIQARIRIVTSKVFNPIQCKNLCDELDTFDAVLTFMEKEYIQWLVSV